MANELLNATFLDGTANWAGTARAIAQTGVGSRGRLVITGTDFILSEPRPLNGRAGVWAAALFRGARFVVRFNDGSGSDVVVPLKRTASEPAARGRPSGFNFARGYIPAPAGATTFQVFIDGPGALMLTKPYASADGLEPCVWQAGPHTNPDLNYPAWPAHLPAIMDEGLQFDPIPTRKGFSGDSGVEATRRITRSRRYHMTGQVGLTTAERDALMDFFDANPGKFWFTRPDTREVSLAQWKSDGEPVDAGQLPGRRRTQFKLQLTVP